MTPLWFLFLPFLIQAFAIGFDEFYFHLKRGLPRWERIGHPVDTLSTIACFAYVLFTPYSTASLPYFITLCIISSLLITKDEWVHRKHCEGREQWLHALLFINHPLLLIALGILWSFFTKHPLFFVFASIQLGLSALFFSYQLIYWNFLWKERAK